jgi:hypothetical protein
MSAQTGDGDDEHKAAGRERDGRRASRQDEMESICANTSAGQITKSVCACHDRRRRRRQGDVPHAGRPFLLLPRPRALCLRLRSRRSA